MSNVDGFAGSVGNERLDWWRRAGLIDYFLALNNAQSRLPVIGRYFADLGSLAALGFWGAKHAPDIIATVRSRLGDNSAEDRRRERNAAADIAQTVLADVMAEHELDVIWPPPQRVPPVMRASGDRCHVYAESVAYGDHPDQVLDVWRREGLGDVPAPVVLFIPGGAWVFGKRLLQGHSLMAYLAQQGFVCLSLQYRVAPSHKWPSSLRDVKAAIAWARENIGSYGGDGEFIALAGCSAGGHLASLAGLTAGDPRYSAHLHPEADTTVDAVVSIYGRYDWQDRAARDRERFVDFLERVVVQRRYAFAPEVFAEASPINHVHTQSPPFLVVHGTGDSIIPVEEARAFTRLLDKTSLQPVTYLELPGAEHAFDLIDGARTGPVNVAIGVFLEATYRRHQIARREAAVSQ